MEYNGDAGEEVDGLRYAIHSLVLNNVAGFQWGKGVVLDAERTQEKKIMDGTKGEKGTGQ